MGVVLAIIIEQVAFNKLTLILKVQKKKTIQLFTMNIKTESFTKVIRNAKFEGLGVKRPSGLLKIRRKYKHFKLR